MFPLIRLLLISCYTRPEESPFKSPQVALLCENLMTTFDFSPESLSFDSLLTRNLPRIAVPTASIVPYDINNPEVVILIENEKHPKPLFVGGKIDLADKSGDSELETARNAAVRELWEEIQVKPLEIKYLGIFTGTEDVRIVSRESLRGTLAEEACRNTKERDVIAYYGNPDFIFAAGVDVSRVRTSSEVTSFSVVRVSEILDNMLAASHGRILELYKASL